MILATVQTAPILGNKLKNITILENYINQIDCDIIVFPELSTSGYYFLNREEVKAISEPFNGEIISYFSELSKKLNKIIVFGFAEKDGEKLYNSAVALFPDSSLNKVYRKTHLFYREYFCFDKGDTGFFVIEDKSRDLKLGLMICYGWRFPESARTLGLLGADLIVCPSNLITNVWNISMPSRALENKVFLTCSNRYGTEERDGDKLLFKGKSAIYDYNGRIIAEAQPEGDEVLYADIEPSETRDKSFNPYNDIFKDRRTEMYL